MRRFTFIFLFCAGFSYILSAQSGFDIHDEQTLQQYLKSKNFSGAVLFKSQSGDILKAATGSSDLEGKSTLTADSKFRIASITKLFTAVLIMQLHDEGKLMLNNTISDFLPDLSITNADKINIKNLLQHTSGLRKESNISYLKHHSPDDLIDRFATKKAKFNPGEEIKYNNIDFVILGLIIEKITGQSYAENLDSGIIKKLGLNNTGLNTLDAPGENVVKSFQIKRGKKTKEINIYAENLWAAGAMYSTVDDLLVFTDALKSGRLVSKEAMDALFNSEPKFGYVALGSWVFNSPFIEGKPRVVERRGEIMGSTSVVMSHLDGPETVIILSNTDAFRPETFGQSDNIKEYLFKSLFAQKKQ